MKHKTWSRALSLAMSVIMLVSLLCVPAMAYDVEPEENNDIAVQTNTDIESVPQENESQENGEYDENGFAKDGSYQPAELVDGVYEIGNAGQLYWFARLVNGYYNSSSDYEIGQNDVNARLTDDITVNEEISESALKWMPISSETLRYMGTFDGNGHSICGLYFPGTTTYTDEDAEHYAAAVVVYEKDGRVMKNGDVNGDVDAGLFGFIGKNGVVKNVTVKDSVFKNGYMNIGAIAGTNDGTVQNCTSENNTVLGNHSVGGVVGGNNYEADTTLLKDCKNSSHVTALSQGGGIAGANSTGGTVENCTNNGTIDGTATIGGIVGSNSGKITDCVNNGAVTSSGDYAGGIAAAMGNAKVVNCTNHGAVMAGSTTSENDGYWVGGIAGYATGNTAVANCTNTGDVSAAVADAGGIVGRLEGTSFVECSSNSGTVTAKMYSGGIIGRMSYSGAGSSINNCFNTGNVTTSADGFYAGGIVGQNGCASTSSADYSSRGGSVKNSWNSGKVAPSGNYADYAGGIYGNLYGTATVENCYYLDSSAAKAGINGSITELDGMEPAQSDKVFASGKITWYLNHKGDNTKTVWYQNVDNDAAQDAYPVLDLESAVVYACGTADETLGASYTNMAETDFDAHDLTWNYTAEQHWNVCARCGAAETAANHSFGAWETVRTATSSVPGIEQRSCSDCGFTEQRDIYADKSEDKLPETVSGDVIKSVEVKTGAPATTMNTSKSDLMDSVLTSDEKDAVATGSIAHIWLEVTALDEDDVPSDDRAATEAQANRIVGKNAEIVYLDISMFKQMSNSEQEQIFQTSTPISVTITIPENIRTAADGMRRTFYVLRSHADGGTTTCTPITGKYDSNTGAFTFETDRFSTYALVYKDTVISSGGHTSSSTIVRPSKNTGWKLSYQKCPKDKTCPIWPFTDASTTRWYHDGVHFCLENGLMVGYGSNTFQPDAGTTRGMIAVMLWRLNGSPVVNYAMSFDDVKNGAWYTEAIRWAVSEGIAFGYGNGKFGPDDVVTREQMVTILYRYAQRKGYDVSVGKNTNILSYDDAFSVAQYAVLAMQWACGSGMVTGQKHAGSMILDPQGTTTRAQMATMMMRFCAEIAK